MTSPSSSTTWLPAALARAAVVTAPPAQAVPAPGRHRAPERPGTPRRIATPDDVMRKGRHAAPERHR